MAIEQGEHGGTRPAGAPPRGRQRQRPRVVDALAGERGARRRLRELRLKEWLGFTLVHPELWSSMIIQDAHYLASSEIYVADRGGARMAEHAAPMLGSLRLPGELFGRRYGFTRDGYRIEYAFAEPGGQHRIHVDVAADTRAPAFAAELVLDGAGASAPLSVGADLPGGRMYTHKAIFPASGWLRVGDREYAFDGDRDAVILDEHRSFLPYRTEWLWGTFATRDADGLLGANFAQRPIMSDAADESCLWAADGCAELTRVSFDGAPTNPAARQYMRSADGRLDVSFTPAGHKVVTHQLGVFAIDYFQAYGYYSGSVRDEHGRTRSIDGAHGVYERMNARL